MSGIKFSLLLKDSLNQSAECYTIICMPKLKYLAMSCYDVIKAFNKPIHHIVNSIFVLFLFLQIHLHMNTFKLSNQSLEVGLSYNFEVLSNCFFQLAPELN